jgi:hypothetical protein
MAMSEIVYILSNPDMRGVLKIGRTSRDDVSVRMKELYTTSVALPFDCVYACIVKDNKEVESLMHKRFEKYRRAPRREFFKVSAREAVKALKRYELEDVTPAVREESDAKLLVDERDARRAARRELEKIDPSVAEAKYLHQTITGS